MPSSQIAPVIYTTYVPLADAPATRGSAPWQQPGADKFTAAAIALLRQRHAR